MSEQETEVVEAVGPGSLLKEVRKQQGLSIKEVASQLKLMEQSVKNIEADNYKDIPIAFYKGYIKNYAHLLGLNPDKTHEALCNYLSSQGVDADCTLAPAYKDERIIKKKSRQLSTFFTKLISFLIVLAIVYSIYYLLIEKSYWNKFIASFDKEASQQEQPLNNDADENEGELIPIENTSSRTTVNNTLPLSNDNLSDTSGELILENSENNIEPSLDGRSANLIEEAPSESTTQSLASSSDGLTLNFSGDCWVQVVDATGRVLISGTKSNGHVSQVAGQAPYQLTIGKVSSVAIEYLGEPVDLSAYSDRRIAKFTLGG